MRRFSRLMGGTEMNVQTSSVMAPPAPRSLEGMLLPMAMMRDILIKTMFRMNLDLNIAHHGLRQKHAVNTARRGWRHYTT